MSDSACPLHSRRASRWTTPTPLAYPESIQAAGGLAAPLLAGFTFAIIVQLATTAEAVTRLRWPEATLAILLSSAFLLILSVQAAIWARQYQVTPPEVEAWTQGTDPRTAASLQHLLHRQNLWWAAATRFAYHFGVALLLFGVALTLVPTGDVSEGRAIVLALAFGAFAFEFSWIIAAPLIARVADRWANDGRHCSCDAAPAPEAGSAHASAPAAASDARTGP